MNNLVDRLRNWSLLTNEWRMDSLSRDLEIAADKIEEMRDRLQLLEDTRDRDLERYARSANSSMDSRSTNTVDAIMLANGVKS